MLNIFRILATMFLIAALVPAKAAFNQISFAGEISCIIPETTATLTFFPGAPNGDYSALIQSGSTSDHLSIDGETLTAEGFRKSFNIPSNEASGLNFTVGYDLAALFKMGSFEDFLVPFSVNPGDETTSLTGFGGTSGNLTISDDGCTITDDDDSGNNDGLTPIEELNDSIVEVVSDDFVGVNTNELISNEKDLKVNVSYKIPTTLYKAFVGKLKEGEDITEKAKELAKRFGFKLDFVKLKKAAAKELKEATKGLKGDSRKEAIEAARKKGFNKLLSEIRLKLPKVQKGDDKATVRKKRKAKKKKILEALEAEVKGITEDADSGNTCLSFILTLPAKICAKDANTKTLVIGDQSIDFLNLEPGESFSIDIPVKIVGNFQEFFGTENAKGKANGKTDITLTLTNPATE